MLAYPGHAGSDARLERSALFVPASRWAMIEKAAASAADIAPATGEVNLPLAIDVAALGEQLLGRQERRQPGGVGRIEEAVGDAEHE